MRKFLLFISLLPIVVNAQLITNQKAFGTLSVELSLKVIPTNDDGFIFIQSAGQNTLDKNCQEYGLYDVWVFKTDASYNMLWQSCYGSSDGNEYAAAGIATFDGGFITIGVTTATSLSGNNAVISNGGNDYLLVKFDSNGNVLWDKNFGGAGNDLAYGIAALTDSTYVIVGHSDSNASFDKSEDSFGLTDIWVVAVDKDGNKLWDKTIGGDQSEYVYYGQIVVLTEEESFYLIAESSSGISGNKTLSSFGVSDNWLVKLNYSGSILNQAVYGGTYNEGPQLLFRSADNHLIIGSTSQSGISGNKTSEARGMRACWILKTDLNGNIVWDVTLGGTVTSINDGPFNYLEEGNEILFAASSNSNIGFDKTEDSRGSSDLWLLFLDPNTGSLLRQKTIGGDKIEYPSGISKQGNKLILFANTESGISGDKTVPKISPISYIRDRWIIEMDLNTLNKYKLNASEISMYPNPSRDIVQLTGLQPYIGGELLLINALGQLIQTEAIQAENLAINTSTLNQGIYFIKISDGPSLKVIIE